MSARKPIGFGSARRKAEKLKGNPKKTKEMLGEAYKKATKKKGTLAEIWEDLMALFRLANAYQKGHYRSIGWKSIATVMGALIYFLSPLDIIPDFIPALGFLDDAGVIAYVVRQLSKEIIAFKDWESNLEEVPYKDEL